MDFEGMVN